MPRTLFSGLFRTSARGKFAGSLKINPYLFFIFLFFGAVFASITFVNHYMFRTYGWDLGINHNAIWDYAHFRWNDCMIMLPNKAFSNVLSDHFSLYPLLVSPFYWIFGTWTMLLLQFGAILFGGFGIYRLILSISNKPSLAYLAVIHFFSFYGIYSALGFDYHDNVVAAMFVPWLILHFRNGQWKWVGFYFLLILISKENMALWLVFIGIGLGFRALLNKRKDHLILSIVLTILSLLYFVLIIKIVIPALAIEETEYMHNSFTALGENFGEVFKNILFHPLDALNLLFENHSHNREFDGIKQESYFALLFAGGLALFFVPEYLIMALPILGQKMFNDEPSRWGINYHYSIEFAPLLVIALYTLLAKVSDRNFFRLRRKGYGEVKSHVPKINTQNSLAVVSVLFCLGSTVHFMDNRVSTYYKKENVKFYSAKHWSQNFDVGATHKLLKSIPPSAKVSAQSALAPHLAFRDFIYHFPYIGDAEYIALFVIDPNPYPMSWSEYERNIIEMKNSGEWEVFKQNNAVLILKRK